MSTFHVRIGEYARAFASPPVHVWASIIMLSKGWRPFNGNWWSRGNTHQRKLEHPL